MEREFLKQFFQDKNKAIFFLVLILNLFIGFYIIYPFLNGFLSTLFKGIVWDFGYVKINLENLFQIITIFFILIGSLHIAEESSRVR